MKHLENFNKYGFSALDAHNSNSPFKKNFGEEYPIENLIPGEEIIYAGSGYYVINVDDAVVNLSSTLGGQKTKTLNQQMFNEKGAISKNNK